MRILWQRLVPRHRIYVACAFLFLLSSAFFLYGIGFTEKHSFDEFHYVPSAKQFLDWKENSNWEHPPLAKMLMAVGIALFGDGPLGWRFMSTLFGGLTVVGMFLWGLALFGDFTIAGWVAALSLADHLIFVQARIGMLDTFMMGFLTWAMAAFTAAWNPRLERKMLRRYLLTSGICFGLAAACKWFALMPLLGCVGLVLGVRLFQYWGVRFTAPVASGSAQAAQARNRPDSSASEEWYADSLWRDIRWRDWALFLGVVPFVVYYLTFIPLLLIQKPALGLLEFFPMQKKMYEGQLRVVNSHPYMSGWKQWPLITRPIWYTFDRDDKSNLVHGVALIGSPLVMWGGLLALVLALYDWVRNRARDSGIVLFSYAVLFGSWVLIPRKVSFYYYYYPAGVSLSLALAWLFFRGLARDRILANETARYTGWAFLGASFGLFAYFYPILSGMPIPGEAFRRWMWFTSWI